MNQQKTPRLKPLLDRVPPGFMVDTPWLRGRGIDPKSIHDYVARGWLKRVIRGVYRRPLPEGAQGADETSWEISLLSLQWIMKYAVHLGGESALDMAGYAHYLSLGGRSRVQFYGEVPSWLKRLPMQTEIVMRRRTLLGDDPVGTDEAGLETGSIGASVEVWRWPIKASSPERAHPRGAQRAAAPRKLREPGQDLRRTGVAETETAHGAAERMPQREGAPAVSCLRGQARSWMAQVPGYFEDRPRVRTAGPC